MNSNASFLLMKAFSNLQIRDLFGLLFGVLALDVVSFSLIKKILFTDQMIKLLIKVNKILILFNRSQDTGHFIFILVI
jgi:hypothetical protein